MSDPKSAGSESVTPPPARKSSHRGAEVRDTVAEMTAKAQEISQEAGTRVASAMKDLITTAAGLAGFAVESARDLVYFMVRRGQMTQEEADKLMKEVEASQPKKKEAPPAQVNRGLVSQIPAARKSAPPQQTAKKSASPSAAPKKSDAEAASGPKKGAKSSDKPAAGGAAKRAAKSPAKSAAKGATAKAAPTKSAASRSAPSKAPAAKSAAQKKVAATKAPAAKKSAAKSGKAAPRKK